MIMAETVEGSSRSSVEGLYQLERSRLRATQRRRRRAEQALSVAVLALFIGSAYYYPYRYLPYDGPVCGGVTENGCELRWMDVPTEDSDETMPQCVEFCPQQ